MLRQTVNAYLLIFILQFFSPIAFAVGWLKLAPGIEYQDLNSTIFSQWSHIHVFKISLALAKLNLVMARDLSHQYASAYEFAHHSHALLAINGGFFDDNYQPLGLRINNQHQYNPLKQISWWGVFYIKNHRAHLVSSLKYHPDPNVEFAVQTGPRLLVHGVIPPLKPGFAERTALGITKDGHVIILVTENNPLTTTGLAEQLKASPIDCIDALNLDGGSSSQLYTHVGPFKIHSRGFSNVTDAIIVKSREALP